MKRYLTLRDTTKEIVSTITSKGQITIPAEIRRHLGVGTNDRICFQVNDEGEIRLTLPRYSTIDSLRGVAGSLDKSLSKDEMLEIAHEET